MVDITDIFNEYDRNQQQQQPYSQMMLDATVKGQGADNFKTSQNLFDSGLNPNLQHPLHLQPQMSSTTKSVSEANNFKYKQEMIKRQQQNREFRQTTGYSKVTEARGYHDNLVNLSFDQARKYSTDKDREVVETDRINILENNSSDIDKMKIEIDKGVKEASQVNKSQQIRRIHELVALYRCRFKSNLSDAAIMGTLHSAASVIQIHFRYLRHLKEASKTSKSTNQPIIKRSQQKAPSNKLHNKNQQVHMIDKTNSQANQQQLKAAHLVKNSIQHEPNDLYIDSEEDYQQSLEQLSRKKGDLHKDLQSGESDEQYLMTHSRYDPISTIGGGQEEPKLYQDSFEKKTGLNIDSKLSNKEDQNKVINQTNTQNNQQLMLSNIGSKLSKKSNELSNNNSSQLSSQKKSVDREVLQKQAKNEKNPYKTTVQKNFELHQSKNPFENIKKVPQIMVSDDNKNSKPNSNYENNHVLKVHKQISKDSGEQLLNSSALSKGRKTPHIPILDFEKVQYIQNHPSQKEIKVQEQNQGTGSHESQDIFQKAKEVSVEMMDPNQTESKENPNGNKDSWKEYYSGDEQKSQSNLDYPPLTASSYSGIFKTMGLPLPRSARVKVDYEMIKKNPQIKAQLKEIIIFKKEKGILILEEGRKDSLISERTYQKNKGRLERWVNASVGRVDDRVSALKHNLIGAQNANEPMSSASRRNIMKTNEELVAETTLQRQHIAQLLNNHDEKISMQSGTRRSARAITGRSRQSFGSHLGNNQQNLTNIDGMGVQNLGLDDQTLQGLLGQSQRHSAVKLEDEGIDQLNKPGRHSISEFSNLQGVENVALISGRAPNEPSKIMQMIIDSKTTPKQSSDDKDGLSCEDNDDGKDELSEINRNEDQQNRLEAAPDTDVVKFANIQLDLDRWKLMQLADHREVSDLQSNPFASNSSANEFISQGLNNVNAAIVNKNLQIDVKDKQQINESIDEQVQNETEHNQNAEKSMLNRTTSLNLMFQGAPPANINNTNETQLNQKVDDGDLDDIQGVNDFKTGEGIYPVLKVNSKQKHLINNFLVESNDESRAQSRDSSEGILQQEQLSKDVDYLKNTHKINVSSVTSQDMDLQNSKSDSQNQQPQPVKDIISDAQYFLKQLDDRGAQSQDGCLDIENKQIEIIHHGKDPSLEDLVDRQSPQNFSGQVEMQQIVPEKETVSGQVEMTNQINKHSDSFLNLSTTKKDSDSSDKDVDNNRTRANTTNQTNNSLIVLDQTFQTNDSPSKLIKIENQRSNNQSPEKESQEQFNNDSINRNDINEIPLNDSPNQKNMFEDMHINKNQTGGIQQSQNDVGTSIINDAQKDIIIEKKQIIIDSVPQDGQAVGMPVSPLSDNQEFKITTGAHSLSSTDSDMAKAIHQVNRTPALDSPPNLISPKNGIGETLKPMLLNVEDQLLEKQKEEMGKFADEMTLFLLGQMLSELSIDLHTILPRPQLFSRFQVPQIKFFEKKGIKTDLFAIEKYVDEVLEEVQSNKGVFVKELGKPIGKSARDQLKQMQNDEIGNFHHFHQEQPPVLSLDLYLKLEKRRKESREPKNQKDGSNPDGRFEFDPVTNEELQRDSVNRNFLSECQHIHNKVLFDCINDSLQQFRPHGKEGTPMVWSRQSRKLKPTEDFTMEEIFEITKHDLFRMAIMQAGTLPRKEFVFGGHFDEELFAEIREKKLATLLVREIVETEPQWLKWDFEEAQTKIDLADMVLEQIVTETIEFLGTKNNKQKSATDKQV